MLTCLSYGMGFYYLSSQDNIYTILRQLNNKLPQKPWLGYTFLCIKKMKNFALHSIVIVSHQLHNCAQRGEVKCPLESSVTARKLPYSNHSGRFDRQLTKPVGKECFSANFIGRVVWWATDTRSTRNHRRPAWHYGGTQPWFYSLWFHLDGNNTIGFNVTFTTFLLSGLFIPYSGIMIDGKTVQGDVQAKRLYRESVYVWLTRSHVLVYALQRSQWSVFTRYNTDIEYQSCWKCEMNHKSVINFDYQIIKSNMVKTEGDMFHRLRFSRETPRTPYLVHGQIMHKYITYHSAHNQQLKSFSFLIKVKVHQHILFQLKNYSKKGGKQTAKTLWLREKVRFLLMDSTNQQVALEEIKARKTVTYFQCLLLLLSCETNKPFNEYGLNFQPFNTTNQTHCALGKQQHKRLRISLRWTTHQEITRLTSPPDMFINVSIHRVSTTANPNSECFNAGISFMESYFEVLRFCHNFSTESERNFYYPYISASNDIIVTIYADNGAKVDTEISFCTSLCQGLFVNPCILEQTPLPHPIFGNPWFAGKVFPDKFQNHVWVYDSLNKNDAKNCLVVQLAMLYSTHPSENFYVQHSSVMGCSNLFHIKTCRGDGQWTEKCSNMWSSAYVTLFNHHWAPHGSHPISGLTFKDTVSLGFVNKVSLISQTRENQSFSSLHMDRCKENILRRKKFRYFSKPVDKSEWFKRFTFYSTEKENVPNRSHIDKMFLNVTISKTQERTYDILFIDLQPLSKTVVTLKMEIQSGELVDNHMIHSAPHLLPNHSLCLRQPIKGILSKNCILEMTLLSTKGNINQEIGDVLINTNLCFSFWKSFGKLGSEEAMYFIREYMFQSCVFNKSNKGEKQLVWKSVLKTGLFASGRSVKVEMPGKILNAQLYFTNPKIQSLVFSLRFFLLPHQNNLTKDQVAACMNIGLSEEHRYFIYGNLSQLFRISWPKRRRSSSCRWCRQFPFPLLSDSNLPERFEQICYKRWQTFPLELVSRNIWGSFEQTTPTSWLKAADMCLKRESHLPSITSSEDAASIVEFVKEISVSVALMNMFIGITQQVMLRQFGKKNAESTS